MFAFTSKYNGFTSHQIRCLYTAKRSPLLQATGKEEAASQQSAAKPDEKSSSEKKDFDYIKSQIDKANNPGPKRLHTLKDSLHEEWEALKDTFEGAKKDASKVDHPKIQEGIENLEEKHDSITEKVKNWVWKGREQQKDGKSVSK